MGKIVGAVIALGAILGLALFTMLATVEPGEIAVVKEQPWFFGSSRIDDSVVVGPSRQWLAFSSDFVKTSVAPNSIVIHAHDFMSADRVPLEFDAALTWIVADPKQYPAFVQKFGRTPDQVLRALILQTDQNGGQTGETMSYLRDQVRKHGSSVFIAAQNAEGQADDGARAVETDTVSHLNKFLADHGAGMIKITNLALGRANPPEGVRRAIVNTAEQEQNRKTQQARKLTEETRKQSEEAAALADKQYAISFGLTPDQWIELQRIHMYERVCGFDKTNAEHGSMCVFNSTGGTPLALGLPNGQLGHTNAQSATVPPATK